MQRFAVGVDVGGTFTDMICGDGQDLWRVKSPTDPDDFGRGVLDACGQIAAQTGLGLEAFLGRVGRFGLGTTAVTNALVEKSGRRTGLLTTAGFEDTIGLARSRRQSSDGWLEAPWSPVPRERIVGLRERIDRDGVVRTPLSPEEVSDAVRRLREDHDIDALAISFLWSFQNPEHEAMAASIARALVPHLPVFTGAALYPNIREYERSLIAVLNAVAGGSLDGIDALERRLQEQGLRTPLLLLQANGGTTTLAEARRSPLVTIASGPAAGVVAAAELCAEAGLSEAICCDMGGTSFDVAILAEGTPLRVEVGDLHGMILAQPRIDVLSIGAGGGSVAWADDRGLLRVGPRSARAVPGPACYGRGGEDATITDALVVLGYIDPGAFLDGRMPLDRDAAVGACERLGRTLGLGAIEVAWGIRQIACVEMTTAARLRAAGRGLDPRSMAIVSYGGCGGLFAADVAQGAHVPIVLAPAGASVLSALGAATADVRRERMRSVGVRLDAVDPVKIAILLEQLAAAVAEDAAADGVASYACNVVFDAGVRFVRQSSEIAIRLGDARFDPAAVAADFERAYRLRYGEGARSRGVSMELTFLRAVAIGTLHRASVPQDPCRASKGETPRPDGVRAVHIERGAAEVVPVYRAAQLKPDHAFTGPALVDDIDTTVFVPPGARASMDGRRSLRVELGA